MGWADSLVSGFQTGYSIGADARDRAQQRKLREFEIEKGEEASRLRKESKDIDTQAANAVKYASQGLAGDGMGPPESAAGAPEPTVSTPIAAEGVAPAAEAPPPAVGLPAGQVGPGQMRPSAIEAAGATQPGAEQAAAGVAPPATQTMPPVTVKPKDVKKTENFHEARMRIAQERGNGALLERYTKEYASHLSDQVTIDTKKFEKEQLPLLQEMARIKTKAEWEALPEATRAAMLKASTDHAEQSARSGAVGFQLVQNPATRPAGMKILGQVFGLDGPLKDIQKEGDFYIPIGPDGKPATDHAGKPVRVHKDAAERMVAQYGSKAPGIVLAEGAQLRNPSTGALIAENKKDFNASPERANTNINQSNAHVEGLMGVKRDAMGNLMAGVTPEMEKQAAQVKIRAAQLVRGGMSPEDAAAKAVEESKKAPAPGAAAAPGAPAVPAGYTPPWKK